MQQFWLFIYKAISYSPAFAVPSAFVVFTSLFEMERGDILQLKPPRLGNVAGSGFAPQA